MAKITDNKKGQISVKVSKTDLQTSLESNEQLVDALRFNDAVTGFTDEVKGYKALAFLALGKKGTFYFSIEQGGLFVEFFTEVE